VTAVIAAATKITYAPGWVAISKTNTTVPNLTSMAEPSIGYDIEPPEEDTGNDEPSLGWTDEEAARGRTYAGSHGTSADREHGEPARKPQNRTSIDREPITVEVSYRRFLRGLTPEQRKRLAARKGHGGDVILA
jgi:hypothetical protein